MNKSLDVDKKWLWAWVLAPLLFFTFSRNIIWTYTLTALPAFAILVATTWSTLGPRFKQFMQLMIACWLVLMLVGALIWLPQMAEERSARKLVHEASVKYPNMPLYSYGSHEFSVSYYTNAQIHIIENSKMLNEVLFVPNSLLIMSTKLAENLEHSGQGKILDINAFHALLMTNNKSK